MPFNPTATLALSATAAGPAPRPLAVPQLPPLLALSAVPSLPLGGSARDLTPLQQRLMVAAIAAVHVAALWGLLQVNAVRQAVLQAAPMFVAILPPATPAAPKPPLPLPPPPPVPLPVQPLPKQQPLEPLIATAPSPAPAPVVVPAPLPEPAPPSPAPAAPVQAVAAPPPAPPAPAAPRLIPASAVQFVEPPAVEYPRLSRRNAETGTVLVRAFIDTGGGAPRSLQVERSSGFARLDQAALAAVQRARFKPYSENGRPVEGWALIPINFELEK